MDRKTILIITVVAGAVILISGSLLAVFLTTDSGNDDVEERILPNNYYEMDYEIWKEGELVYKPKILGNTVKVVVNQTNSLNMPVEPILPSNNNVALAKCGDRFYLAWRTSPTHFASTETRLHITSTEDPEFSADAWEYENTIYLASDMREPYLLCSTGDEVIFTFFQAGEEATSFEPNALYRSTRSKEGEWSEISTWGHPGEVAWQYMTENNTIFVTSYSGTHYSPQLGTVDNFFNSSIDGGKSFTGSQIYHGGISEIGFSFDLEGKLWAVGRNEDGDFESNWGSRLFTATSEENYSIWKPTEEISDPVIYESPRFFRHGNEIYMIARTDPDGPFYTGIRRFKNRPALRHILDLGLFSTRAHGTALYRLDKHGEKIEFVDFLPGCGDTAFASIVRLGKHKFRVVNYSSPWMLHEDCSEWSWVKGQVHPDGTLLYVVDIEFEK